MTQEEKRDPRIPVDRGWAWVVLAGTLAISTINVGTEKSYGIFFIEFLRKFQGTVSMTAMINAVSNAVYCITAILVLTFGVRKFSVRVYVFVGITMCALGYGLSSLATGLEYLILSQSILMGAGVAFYYPPILLLIGDYFEKRKGIANAIFISGNALGGFIMPHLYRYIFDEYGLSGGLILTTGITSNSLVAAALLRPTEFYTKLNAKSCLSSHSKISRNSHYDDGKKKRAQSEKDGYEGNSDLQDQAISDPLLLQTINGTPIPKQSLITHIPNNDVLDKISNSSIVKYLSSGNIASTSVTSLTEQLESERSSANNENKNHTSSFKNKIDCKLIKNVPFDLFLIIYCLGNVAIMSAHIYIPTYAKDVGIDDSRVAILVSITNFVDFFGRIFCGYLADCSWITPQRIIIISQVVVGVVVQFTAFYSKFWHLVVFVVLLGFTAGMIAALFPPMMIEIVGRKDYARAMAIFIVVVGLFDGAALPLLGYFRDVTNTYHVTFHVIGACSLVTVVLLIVFDVISKRRTHAEEDKETSVNVEL